MELTVMQEWIQHFQPSLLLVADTEEKTHNQEVLEVRGVVLVMEADQAERQPLGKEITAVLLVEILLALAVVEQAQRAQMVQAPLMVLMVVLVQHLQFQVLP
jgi:hypothetical protein